MPAPSTSRRPPARLTHDEIIDAAAALVAEAGYDALSMRRLAQRCGVGAMTLYGYFRTKEELLAALADRFFGAMELPQADDASWEDQVKGVFAVVRRVFLEHSELIPIVASQRVDGIGAYRGAERVFGALRTAGLDDRRRVEAFGALSAFTLGAVQREIGLRRSGAESLPGIRDLPAEDFGEVIGLAGHLMTRDPERDFEAGLDLLIAGISAWAGA